MVRLPTDSRKHRSPSSTRYKTTRFEIDIKIDLSGKSADTCFPFGPRHILEIHLSAMRGLFLRRSTTDTGFSISRGELRTHREAGEPLGSCLFPPFGTTSRLDAAKCRPYRSKGPRQGGRYLLAKGFHYAEQPSGDHFPRHDPKLQSRRQPSHFAGWA